jgi:outer membrane biosynthesis protein TonB
MGNRLDPTRHSNNQHWSVYVLVIIGIAGLIIALLAWRKPVSPVSEQANSGPYTNLVSLSLPSMNSEQKAEHAQPQLEESNRLAKLQDAALPRQIRPQEAERQLQAPEKAAAGLVSKGKELDQFSSTAIPKSNESYAKQQVKPANDKIDHNAKAIAGLRVKVDSLTETPNKELIATFIFANNTTNTIGCALAMADQRGVMATKITDKYGSEFCLDKNKTIRSRVLRNVLWTTS